MKTFRFQKYFMLLVIPIDNFKKGELIMSKFTAIYLRVSTGNQTTGYQAQERALVKYCERNNITNYQIFGDEGVSGARRERVGLNQMLELVHQGFIENVVCYSFSRMARSTKQLIDLLELFKEKEVNFISITEQINTSTSYGKLVFVILSGIAELERTITQERILNGLANARAKGIRLGRKKERNSMLIRELLSTGQYTQTKIAELAGTSRAAVWRELQEMKKEES